ncbi:MAG: Uma2 family endonuclease [Hyphomicrobiaceae bacterium]|nr:Uma2 family endonuclease [Hyphomicrobiaceae bacterium]
MQTNRADTMGEAAHKPATYEDLLAVPRDRVAEIINGALVTHPRPAPKHAMASSYLGAELIAPFSKGRGGPGGWVILDEPELHLGEHVLVPDIAGWRREHLPELPETAWFETPPDWVCEVISPSTARHDRFEKRDLYAAFKVPYLWFVDPDARTVETFELRDQQWVLLATYAGDAEMAAPPFDVVPFSLKALWSY